MNISYRLYIYLESLIFFIIIPIEFIEYAKMQVEMNILKLQAIIS